MFISTQLRFIVNISRQQVKELQTEHSATYDDHNKKSKEGYSSLQADLPLPLRELACHMGSHSVTCHPAEVTFPPLPQPKLVLDLATTEGCKAELT